MNERREKKGTASAQASDDQLIQVTTFTSEAIGNQALNFISAMDFDVLGWFEKP